jgi:hypothetical protein
MKTLWPPVSSGISRGHRRPKASRWSRAEHEPWRSGQAGGRHPPADPSLCLHCDPTASHSPTVTLDRTLSFEYARLVDIEDGAHGGRMGGRAACRGI